MIAPQRRIPEGFGWNVLKINNDFTAWQNGNICALSSVVFIEDENLPAHWEWLISFSDRGKRRLSNNEIKPALIAFDAVSFEEDNHESGIARKYWFAIEEKYRKPCPCKDEGIITEGDYSYSVKVRKNPYVSPALFMASR